ncbi:MAG: prolyl oligopeptidase family serine peptidase [Planctomycetaceae bacterium]
MKRAGQWITGLMLVSVLGGAFMSVGAQDRSLRDNPELALYFEEQVSRLEKDNELTRLKTLAEWQDAKPELREQLFDMLGLSPRPEITPLQGETTGSTEEAEFVVERVHFQSLPGLYVTGNFYRPRNIDGPLPTILYVCGHGKVKKDNVSFGNKTHYHYHGAWFARNGYACLTIDTLQLGEIEGLHHGTYNLDRWWWNSRGYTPAGVEAWNCIRALDYLETRSEVDAQRIGVTGRSGGGAYSWWIAALDDRIRCAVPVAGITSLRDHVINGCVEGHCDCMYMVNTFRWDFAKVAALVAPRPLLISNTDKDTIFPLEGVIDIHRQVRHIYELHDAAENLGLQITEGPHEDTQELHIHAYRWFNRFLKHDKSMIEKTAAKFFEPEQLKVFTQLPTDETNTTIDETFVPQAQLTAIDDVLKDQNAWYNSRLSQLRERCFRAWPDSDPDWKPATETRLESLSVEEFDLPQPESWQRIRIHFESEFHVPLYLDVLFSKEQVLDSLEDAAMIVSNGKDPANSIRSGLSSPLAQSGCIVVFTPRGMGPHAWQGDEAKQRQIRRRFQLIGTTADTQRVWDIRRAIQVTRQVGTSLKAPPVIRGEQSLEELVMLATLFELTIGSQGLIDVTNDPKQWPDILNLTRTITPQELVALVALRNEISVTPESLEVAAFAKKLAEDPRWRAVGVSPLVHPPR